MNTPSTHHDVNFYLGRHHAAGLHGITGALARALAWAVTYPRRRAVLAELAGMTDRELADIGLRRGDVPRVFDAGYRR